MNDYQARLTERLAQYKSQHLPRVDDGAWHHRGTAHSYQHILPKDNHRLNILSGIRDPFWLWFESVRPSVSLHQFFHHLNSSQAMAFNLFFPFLTDGTVDKRLLKALGISDTADYSGCFENVVHPEENTNFDFYMESSEGRRIFFELKLSEEGFGSCADDERHQRKLREQYEPHLRRHVDEKWLEPKTFFANYQVMRNLSYLGRYPDSGVVFIFPKANERLRESEQTIKHVASNSLAPRVAIFYLENLVARILEAVADDEPLHLHYLAFRDKYICI